jgi:serine/threonine protein kinase
VVKEIGRGAFGKIFLATNPKGKNFALKVMDLEKVRSEPNPKVK